MVPNRYGTWGIFIIGLFICFSFIGCYPIYILDEARNAEAAREMYVTGNYIVPFFNGELRTDKPPLHYYFMALGYELFGINAFGARFFSGVFGALTILICFLNTKKWLGRTEALFTTLLLLSALFFIQEFHLVVPDPYLIFFITASLFCFFEFYKSKKFKWLLFAYAGIGLGLLTKGPIAMVIPGISLITFLALKRELKLKTIFSFRPILGILLTLIIAFPWYYLVDSATQGEWTKGFFLDHNLNRFSSEKERHGGFFLLTPLYVILGMLPFSVVIFQSIGHAWKQSKTNDLVLFSLSCVLCTVVFFSFASTKLPNYPMPCYPFIAILIAVYLKQVEKEKASKSLKLSFWFLLFLSVVIPIGAFIALSLEEQFYEVRWVSSFLLLLTISAILGWFFFRKGALKKALLSIAFGWMLTGFSLFGIIYPILTKQSPVSAVMELTGEKADIVVFQRFDSAFPINFNRTFLVFDTIEEIEEYLEQNPKAYILTNTRNREGLAALSKKFGLLIEQKALFENHTTRLFKK